MRIRSRHFAVENGGVRGGGTAPPGQSHAEKTRFFHETLGRMVCYAKRFKQKMLCYGPRCPAVREHPRRK